MPDSVHLGSGAEELLRAADFRLALRRFLAASDRIARSAGLTPRRYLLLLALESLEARQGSATVGDLGATLGLAQGTVTGLLDRAELAGLVVRSPSDADGRVVHVRATGEGKRLFARVFARHAGERRDLLELLADVDSKASA